MVETSKQVRVDNWGIYFLQRLQLFFSKTDFCDLTLQFEGNVQLKVHRLVMNACTEYFAFLENTCPAMEENTILMPSDLQADVIVPIVNFMYTGMLEFHPSIFEKLCKAAETMNIAVLTKLLEAQLRKYNKSQPKKNTMSWGASIKSSVAKKIQKSLPVTSDLPSPLPGKKLPIWRKRQTPQPVAHPVSATFSNTKWNSDPPEKDPLLIFDNTPKPTRFEWPDDDQPPFSSDPSFDDVSLTSKPLWTREDEQKAVPTFEEARSLAQRSRQPASKNNSLSQDGDDDFTPKEQKVNVSPQLEETISLSSENSLKRKTENKTSTSSPKRVKITNQDDETIISIKTSNPSELDHTKIVSEILKKYPDLVKKKKNIKLKITSTKNESPQIKVLEKPKPQPISPVERPSRPSPVRKEVKSEVISTTHKEPAYNNTYNRKVRQRPKAEFRAASEEGPWTCMECLGDGEAPEFVLYYLFRKHMTDVHHLEFDNSLCKYCGRKCSTETSMAYHLFTKHGLRPPSNIKFPQCTTCPFIGVSTDKLQEHMKTHGKDEEQCSYCKLGFSSHKDLINHQQITVHHNRSALSMIDCTYCTKKLQSPISLFMHIRALHLKEARRDGVTSLDETMDVDLEAEAETVEDVKDEDSPPDKEDEEIVIRRIDGKQAQLIKERVNIISNVKVATRQEEGSDSIMTDAVQPPAISDAEHVAVTTTAATLSNIGGSLATNLGLVDIVVLDDNQQYILQQPQGQGGNAEFILPDLTGNEGILQAASAAADLNSTDELVMVLTDHDYQDEQSQGQSDNSNIVVLYSHPVEGQQGQYITSQGNILVNSQGLLEIRNGTAITTTAGQLLMNDTTTTTQALQSPIESIELIRKEIEGNVSEQEEDKESVKAVLRKRVLEKEIQKLEKIDVVINEPSENVNALRGTKSKLENGTGNDLLDTTDSSIQEEPMEVDEIGPPQTDKDHGEEENQLVTSSIENQEPEAANDETNNEEAGPEDVPPDFIKKPQENLDADEVSKTKIITKRLNVEKVVLNESSEFPEASENEEEDTHLTAEDDAMEVDGEEKVDESIEQIEGEDEVDQVAPNVEIQTEYNSTQPDLENQEKISDLPEHESLLDPAGHDGQDQSLSINPGSTEINRLTNLDGDQDQNIENDEESGLVNNEGPGLVDDQEASMDDDPESSISHDQEPSMIHDQEQSVVQSQQITENNQVLSIENDHGTSTGSDRNTDNDQNTDNDHNDQNDNVQSNFDDFTDESQQSSGQKVHRDLNKEILDDWDDTDSQQSHGQEQESQGRESQERESQEEGQDQAAINAVENVNKLMDDWDEDDDEDQSKE